jgi:hypothetical protein
LPNVEDVYRQLEEAIADKERLMQRKHESMDYVAKHHDYVKVAEQYVELYTTELSDKAPPE